jgi:hypothetical protein
MTQIETEFDMCWCCLPCGVSPARSSLVWPFLDGWNWRTWKSEVFEPLASVTPFYLADREAGFNRPARRIESVTTAGATLK